MPRVRCPVCHRSRSVERRRVGTTVHCRHCGKGFTAELPPRDLLAPLRKADLRARVPVALLVAAVLVAVYPALGVLYSGPEALTRPGERAALAVAGVLLALAVTGAVIQRRARRAEARREVEAIERGERRLREREQAKRGPPPVTQPPADTPPGT